MQNKMQRRRHYLIMWSLAFVLLLTSFFDATKRVGAANNAQADELLNYCNEALSWKMKAAGASSAQDLLDKMAGNAGRSPEDWYVLAMAKMGLPLDYSAYAQQLFAVCKDPEPTDVEQYRRYLVARAMGYESIPGTAPERLKNKGIMSVIYRGYAAAAGRASEPFILQEAQRDLMELKLADGGYALMGEASDVDVTGFALQMYGAIRAASGASAVGADFDAAVRDAFASLARKQQADGGYSSFGTPNSESGAMVLLALAAFSEEALPADVRGGIDVNMLIAATEQYHTQNGGYAHSLTDGVASLDNDLATAQVMCAYAAYASYLKGGAGNLYPVKVATSPVVPTTAEITTEATTAEETTQETTKETTAESTEASTEDTTPESSAEESSAEMSTEEPSSQEETEIETTVEDSSSEEATETNENPTQNIETTEIETETTTTALESIDNPIINPTNEENSSESAEASSDVDNTEEGGRALTVSKIRLIMTAVVCALILLAFLANLCSKRKSKLNYILILVFGAAALAFIWLSKITMPEQATQKQQQSYLERLPAQGEFRIEISIDQSLEGEEMLLTPRLVTVSADDTVFEILDRVTKAYGISIDYKKSMVGTVYVRGIGGHAEFDRGAGSGWVFLVNDALATTDAGSVKLEEGDVLRWAYTLDLGKDVSP